MAKPKNAIDRALSRRGFVKAVGASATVAALGGFPAIVRAQAPSIKVGLPTILSGRVAQLGISSTNAVQMAVDDFNNAGGLDGRPIELLIRDTKARPEEASRVTRELINADGAEIIFNAEASSASFAVQEVVREAGVPCIHNVSETSSLTADPNIRSWNTFRTARQGIHDAVGSAAYAAGIVAEKGLTTWMGVSPDYAYGRDNTDLFFRLLEQQAPGIEVVGNGWPKLFQPDYTEVITQVLQKRPDAIYTALWGGDLVSFIDQATLYGLFDQVAFFAINLADYTTLTALKSLPDGLHSGTRYISSYPNTEANRNFDSAYSARYGDRPTNWSWECAVGIDFLIAALRAVGGTDPRALAEALSGMTRKSFIGVGENETVTMRADDRTLIEYAIGWGTTISDDPYVINIKTTDWADVLEAESAWKQELGYV